jgi:hypothetical protein
MIRQPSVLAKFIDHVIDQEFTILSVPIEPHQLSVSRAWKSRTWQLSDQSVQPYYFLTLIFVQPMTVTEG